jgi:hypothetical protein
MDTRRLEFTGEMTRRKSRDGFDIGASIVLPHTISGQISFRKLFPAKFVE